MVTVPIFVVFHCVIYPQLFGYSQTLRWDSYYLLYVYSMYSPCTHRIVAYLLSVQLWSPMLQVIGPLACYWTNLYHHYSTYHYWHPSIISCPLAWTGLHFPSISRRQLKWKASGAILMAQLLCNCELTCHSWRQCCNQSVVERWALCEGFAYSP